MPSLKKSHRASKSDSQIIFLRSEEDGDTKHAKVQVALDILRNSNGLTSSAVIEAANKRLLAYLA